MFLIFILVFNLIFILIFIIIVNIGLDMSEINIKEKSTSQSLATIRVASDFGAAPVPSVPPGPPSGHINHKNCLRHKVNKIISE